MDPMGDTSLDGQDYSHEPNGVSYRDFNASKFQMIPNGKSLIEPTTPLKINMEHNQGGLKFGRSFSFLNG